MPPFFKKHYIFNQDLSLRHTEGKVTFCICREFGLKQQTVFIIPAAKLITILKVCEFNFL